MPDLQDPGIEVQVVATTSSLHFYSQEKVDAAVMKALNLEGDERQSEGATGEVGVKVWRDADEWSVSNQSH
jgi:phosphopantothenoylcysteine decarboxylase